MCGSPDCATKKIPDQILIQLLKNRVETRQYLPIRFPAEFKKAATFDWMDRVRSRLLKVMPETSLDTAKSYLRDASYLLFVWRSMQSIIKSDSKDLIDPFERILERKVDTELIHNLQSMTQELKESSDRGKLDDFAMRYKALFYLIRAGRILGVG